MKAEATNTRNPIRKRLPTKPEDASNIDDIVAAVASLADLQREMAQSYTTVVQDIIQGRSHDVQQIEHTLDRLVSCAGQPDGLHLFKSLCRYYYGIDPAAAARHVYFYREMWDSDTESTEEVAP